MLSTRPSMASIRPQSFVRRRLPRLLRFFFIGIQTPVAKAVGVRGGPVACPNAMPLSCLTRGFATVMRRYRQTMCADHGSSQAQEPVRRSSSLVSRSAVQQVHGSADLRPGEACEKKEELWTEVSYVQKYPTVPTGKGNMYACVMSSSAMRSEAGKQAKRRCVSGSRLSR